MHTVIIFKGLPGSGKTCFANQVSLVCNNVSYIDINSVIENESWNDCNITDMCFDAPNIIVDGRIYDEHTVAKIINAWEKNDPSSKYIVIQWKNDTEACINNLMSNTCAGQGFSREKAESIVYAANMMPFSEDIIAGETGISEVSVIYRDTIDFTKDKEIVNKEFGLGQILIDNVLS